jgi:predicted molibdopterin-dependent oxidoreductase YjgC
MVSLTINGQKVEVEPETTILQAAEKLGIFIPTFCYDPELTRVGACRMCVVEVEKARTLVASCCTPVAEGMVVHTDTERVYTARKANLSLLLANHPLDCLTCEKTGNCRLQDYCYIYGVSESEYSGARKNYPLDDSNPFFIRDMNKCILCGLCVRKCHEINGAGAVEFMKRGFDTKVTAAFDDPLENSSCVFCGMCVDACPVGALVPKQGIRQGRPWELTKVKTVCPYCGTGCGLELYVKDNKVVGVKGDASNPVNRGQTCVKGRFGYQFINHPDRLTTPLIKRNGRFEEASWDEALDLVASKFREVQEKYGPEALGGLSSARATNESNYLFQKLLRSLGTNSIDHCARL